MRRPERNAPEFVERLRSMIEDQGMTHEAVGAVLGVAPQTIGKWCAKHGIRCHQRGPRRGPLHPDWTGGRSSDKNGYVLVYCPGHPEATRGLQTKTGRMYALEHRKVMSDHLGRPLLRTEVVHHKNGNKQDNRIENLELFEANGQHLRHELTGRCPKWSEEGRARIRKAHAQWCASRKSSRTDDVPRHEEPSRPPSLPETYGPYLDLFETDGTLAE